ncbi:MAG: biosynthetic peptidoglycan transglycosylase, partial [Chloroflexota bacterium]
MHRVPRYWRARSRGQRIGLLLGVLLALGGGLIYAWLLRDLPSISDLEAGMALPSTRITDRHGRLLYQIADPRTGVNQVITLDELPEHLAQATVATEDANFYRHPGVDLEGVARALWINVRGGEVVAGGSTITQQVARNLLLDPDQRAERTL